MGGFYFSWINLLKKCKAAGTFPYDVKGSPFFSRI